MSNLKKLIKDNDHTMQDVITKTKIHRNKFFLGLRFPAIFSEKELKLISKATKIPYTEIQKAIWSGIMLLKW